MKMCSENHRHTKIITWKYLPREDGPFVYIQREFCLNCYNELERKESHGN